MGRQSNPLEAPALAVGQVLFFEAREKFEDVGRSRLMVEILDLWTVTRRVGGHIVLERHRNVDYFARHAFTSPSCRGLVPGIHVFTVLASFKTWMAGTSPAMTKRRETMPAYWVARSKINDPVEYKKYTDLVPAIIAKFGGKVLARGGRFQIMEGPDKFHRFIVIEFPTLEQGVACFTSPEYDKAAAFRRSGAGEVETIMVEGV